MVVVYLVTVNTLSKMKVRTGDVFLVWRIRELVAQGRLQVQGDWSKGWKELTVSFSGTGNAESVVIETEA